LLKPLSFTYAVIESQPLLPSEMFDFEAASAAFAV